MSTKKERTMTPKGFLHKTTTKAANSADAFLKAHRAWLESGELASLTSPILRKLDDGEVMPTPALEAIKSVVYGHMIASEIRKGEESIARQEQGGKGPGASKPWIGTIHNADGQIAVKINEEGEEVLLQQGFEKPQECERWVDRRLFEGTDGQFGVVASTTLIGPKTGSPISSTIMRQDAIARILKQKGGPVMKSSAKSSSKLGFGVKAKQSTAKFSHG